MEFPLHILQQNLLAMGYVVTILIFQALFEELFLPRLSFAKSTSNDFRQMLVRWVLSARRFDFEFSRDTIGIFNGALLIGAIAILPLNGVSGVKVERPDLAIAQIMAIFCFLRVLSAWKSQDVKFWEKALEEILLATTKIFVFLLIIDGAYLSSASDHFERMMGADWLVFSGPFHLIAFILGVLLVGFFQGRQEYRKDLRGFNLFAWKAEPILWITLLLVTFLNTATTPGLSHFFALLLKCISIFFILALVRAHMPKIRIDQIERIGLTVIYPVAILIFIGMWWQELLK